MCVLVRVFMRARVCVYVYVSVYEYACVCVCACTYVLSVTCLGILENLKICCIKVARVIACVLICEVT